MRGTKARLARRMARQAEDETNLQVYQLIRGDLMMRKNVHLFVNFEKNLERRMKRKLNGKLHRD